MKSHLRGHWKDSFQKYSISRLHSSEKVFIPILGLTVASKLIYIEL